MAEYRDSADGSKWIKDCENEKFDDDEERYSSVLVEMEKKYYCEETVQSDIILNLSVGTSSPCKLALESRLEIIILNNKYIRYIGDIGRFKSLATMLKEVDLAWNHLTTWCDVAVLMDIPNLQILNLSHNPLDPIIDIELPTAHHLRTIIMNYVHLPFATVRQFLLKMPSLHELHLSNNSSLREYFDVPLIDEVISDTVRIVHFVQCNISNWETVLTLKKHFPSITSVFLCENPIETISFRTEPDQRNIFDGVSYLNMNKCLISDWRSVEALADITSIREIRLQHIPLLNEYSNTEKIHLIIARLPLVQALNGSPITAKEREVSERFFLRYYDKEEEKPAIYHTLLLRHGHIEQLCKVDLTPKSYANVIVKCEETGYMDNFKLRLAQSVSSLMRTFEKLLNIHHKRMRVFHSSSRIPTLEELRYPNIKLHSLRIEDGDEFTVQSKAVVISRKTKSKI